MTQTPHIDYGIKPLRCGSVCSGIEAFSVGVRDMPYEMAWLSEIERFPCSVLAHHYPEVPNLGDMTQIFHNETFINESIELLVGGTPCQSFSIAGLRGGLDDDRGNLALVFARSLLQKQPRWFIWENVPGVFSSYTDDADETTERSDFLSILSGFRECGYSVSYRVLDPQYFGVPQRRRRVFVVGHLGDDWRPSAAVLFERESLCRDITPRREARKEATGVSGASIEVSGAFGLDEEVNGNLEMIGAMKSHNSGGNQYSVIAPDTSDTLTKNANQTTGFCGDVMATLGKEQSKDTKFFSIQGIGESKESANTHTLSKRDYKDATDLITVPFTQSSHGNYKEGVGTDRANGGDIGGGSETILCIQTAQTGANGSNISEDVSFTLDKASVPAVCLQVSMIGRDDKNGPQGDGINVEQSFTLNKTDHHAVTAPVCFQQNADGEVREGDVSGTLNKNSNASGRNTAMIHTTHIARRLTPKECLRLQGFPDDYLDIPSASDSAKYAAVGNSMTTHVMRWLAHRIALFEKISMKIA